MALLMKIDNWIFSTVLHLPPDPPLIIFRNCTEKQNQLS